MSKKVETIKNYVFLSEQDPSKLAGLIASLITDVATSILISGADSVEIPSGDSTSESYTASLLSQFGDSMSGTVTISIDGDAPTGVSLSNGTLTVESTASAGTVTLKAASGSITATKEVELTASE